MSSIMDTDHQVIKHSNSQLTFAEKLRRSKALIPTLAVMGVTVMALAAALVVNNSGAQPGGTTVGLGTVAGGVVGGLLGNQVGGGNGKTAMTVLGVAGGAFAGNTIEKNMKKVTVYQMRVRMNDGSLRTVEQAGAIQSGSRVIVEGNTLRLAPTASSSAATSLSYSAALA